MYMAQFLQTLSRMKKWMITVDAFGAWCECIFQSTIPFVPGSGSEGYVKRLVMSKHDKYLSPSIEKLCVRSE